MPLAAVVLAAALALPAGSAFAVRTAADEPVAGRLAELGPDWRVALADPDRTVAGADVVSLARTDAARPPWPTAAGLILANGDRIPGAVLGGDDLALRFRPAFAPAAAAPWRVPLSAVQVAWLAQPPGDTPPLPARYGWLPADRTTDVVLLRNGDVLRGTLDRLTDDAGVRLRIGGKATDLPAAAVAAVAFNPSLTAVRRPKGVSARLVTASGARVTLATATADAVTLRGTTAFNARFELPVREVITLDLIGGKAAYLSDMKPAAATVEPFAGLAWPWAADRGVKDRPLTLLGPHGPDTFDKGLGTHPKTTLTYALTGRHRRFEAVVGLDAATGRRGSAVARVLVDDRVRQTLDLAADRPATVSVDIAKAKRLTLVTDFGPAGDVQADVAWADARLME